MKNHKIKILLIDDEPDILEIVGYNLKQEGYQVFTALGGREGLDKAKAIKPDLIILDVMMPGMDGIEVCEEIRKDPKLSETMVVFLTARNEDYSQMAGLEAGADDYIAKPIKPKVLISKIKSLLRRLDKGTESAASGHKKTPAKESHLIIDTDRYKVIKGKKELSLPRKEFELLSLLVSKPEKVFKRDEILSMVWGNDIIVGARTIDVHIRKLRKKIGDKHIFTVKGIGYKYLP